MNCSGGQQMQQQQPNRSTNKANQNIQVYVRVRPLNNRERLIRSQEVVEVIQPKEIVVRHMIDSKVTKKFTFDRAFGPDSRQCEVYHSVVSPLIEEVLSGYNCTVFAYGQTGTGKTHTMIGTECPELKSSWEDESMIGIIPRALCHLFDELRMMEVEFSMRISYLELYNEELCDLLSSDDASKIRIFDDGNKKGSVIIQGLEEIPVHSKDDVYKLLEKGKERRKTATTLMNAQSSRSHTVFSILVHIKENGIDGEEMLKIGKLNLVDLAGSENVTKAGNEKGIRTRETVNINQSLLTLGRVITALVERTPHIPYRESKLTRILQESLGGRTKTSIIATISPGHKDLEETLSTLEYAHRAKNIQNKPEINQKLTKKTVLKEYTEEIDRLKRDLMAARDKNGIYLAEETYNDMAYKLDSQNRELNEKVLLIKALKEDLASKEKLFNEVSMHLIEKSDELVKKEKYLSQTKSELDQTVKVLNTTKRRYKEKKVLLESHVKTEKDLTEQATKLIEVADVATTDTTKLHETLERRKDVDSKINSACDEFFKKMQNSFSSMEKNLDKLQTEHQSLSQLIIDETESNTDLHQEFSRTIIDNVQNISDYHKDSLTDITDCIDKYSKILSEMNSENKDVICSMMNELKQKENQIKGNVNENYTKMLNLIDKKNSIIKLNYEENIENLKKIHNLIELRSNEINQNAITFIEVAEKLFSTELTKICKDIEKRKEISDKREKILQNFIMQMQEIRNEEEQDRMNIENVPENIIKIKDNILSDKTKEINSFKEFNNECFKILERTENKSSEYKDKILSLENEHKIEIGNGNDLINVHNVEQINKIDELMNMEEMKNVKFNETTDREMEEILCIKNKSSNTVENNCKSAQDTINNECNRIKQHKVGNFALQTSLQNCVKTYTSNYNEQISNCTISLQNFYKSELKTYTPTGQTPARKEFSYPRILAATSPHSRIIKRFRLEKDWSDLDTTSMTDDNDTTIYELSSDDHMILDSVNSTPIKSNNDLITTTNKLKNIPLNFNFKIPTIPTKLDESNNSLSQNSNSKLNSPAVHNGSCEEENKENCF